MGVRNVRNFLLGVVVSDQMQKTITVAVNYYKDSLYGKRTKKTHKFHVHDEKEIAKIGDVVNFIETRPLSKTKKFCLLNILASNHKQQYVEELQV